MSYFCRTPKSQLNTEVIAEERWINSELAEGRRSHRGTATTTVALERTPRVDRPSYCPMSNFVHDFLFIDEGAKGPTRDRKDTSGKHRHIQQQILRRKAADTGAFISPSILLARDVKTSRSAFAKVTDKAVSITGCEITEDALRPSRDSQHPSIDVDQKERAHRDYEHKSTKRKGRVQLFRPVATEGSTVDPFRCSSHPITDPVHNLLTYFQTLWSSRYPGTAYGKHIDDDPFACHHVLRDCITDGLVMACVLAAMSARLESFHSCSSQKLTDRCINEALRLLRQRLSAAVTQDSLDGQIVYAILKLYGAEAYRSNLDRAMVHLHGASAAASNLISWADVEPKYVLTMCGTGEATLLPRVWQSPASFPIVMDPGSLQAYKSKDSTYQALLDKALLSGVDTTGRLINQWLSSAPAEIYRLTSISTLGEVVSDMREWATVRRGLLQSPAGDESEISRAIKWTHLRRFALVFRLMSVSAAGDAFSHCLRVSLIVWLAIAADLSGFQRNLEIVAKHLIQILDQIHVSEEQYQEELVLWSLYLGAIIASPETDRSWFVERLRVYTRRAVTDGWCAKEHSCSQYLQAICERCFYLSAIEIRNVQDVSRWLEEAEA